MGDLIAGGDRAKAVAVLFTETISRRRMPQDYLEIAAILESMGWTDKTVQDVFGAQDVFELARRLWEMTKDHSFEPRVPDEPQPRGRRIWKELIGSFARGTIFALPMAVSVFSMLVLDFSLWSYQYFSLEYATSIAVGTIMSFMVVGGFTQAIGRRGFLYISQGHYYTARRVVFTFVRLGYATSLIVGLLALVVNIVFSIFPWRMMVLIILYYSLLCAIWLSVTIMYIMKREITFTGLIIAGIAIVFLLFRCFHLNIIVAQGIALVVVAVSGLFVAEYYFRRAEQSMEQGIRSPLPRLSIVIYTSLPFLAYGFLYFTFLFVDRIIAWSTNSVYMPYLIWFRGEYELGLDLALIGLVLPMGFIEVVVSEMMLGLVAGQKLHQISDTKLFTHKYLRFYYKSLAAVTVLSLLNAAALAVVLNFMARHNTLGMSIFLDPTTRFVFGWALLAYVLVALGLMNILVLFCLSCQDIVVRLMATSMAVNMLVGFVLSRWFDYSWAVFGLLAGSLAFVFLTIRAVLSVIAHLDYHLYAASS